MIRFTHLPTAALLFTLALPLAAQPPIIPIERADELVARIALYPDPLLAQIFTAATYSGDIREAARWADRHRYTSGESLARAIDVDRLPWAPSVIALLPFPQVLDIMASDMGWTTALGDAVLAQSYLLMDAVQNIRHDAVQSGYLRDSAQRLLMNGGGGIQILPTEPGYYTCRSTIQAWCCGAADPASALRPALDRASS